MQRRRVGITRAQGGGALGDLALAGGDDAERDHTEQQASDGDTPEHAERQGELHRKSRFLKRKAATASRPTAQATPVTVAHDR
jgi:hypothetical protein